MYRASISSVIVSVQDSASDAVPGSRRYQVGRRRHGARMSDTAWVRMIRRLVSILLPQRLTLESITPALARTTPTPGASPTQASASNPPRPPLFAPRDSAEPGQQYARLLAIPEALSPEHRRAHLLAVRGLMHARQARHEAASKAFGEALSINPRLDLTMLPTFWDLPRAGCEAAVQAYQGAGLTAEATTLNARLRQALRPRLLSPPAASRGRQLS